MKKIITTVGTSLITNAIDKEKVRSEVYEVLQPKSYSQSGESSLEDYIKSIKEGLNNYIESDNQNLSAEIASILKIVEQEPNEQYEVYLIATDTILSPICAEYVKNWFEVHKQANVQNVYFKYPADNQRYNNFIIEKLQVRNQSDFETSGLENLQKAIVKHITIIKPKKKHRDWKNTIFNITGGYKAIIPYMTIFAQINNVPSYYIFKEERNSEYELLNIPFSPAPFDPELMEQLYPHLADINNTSKDVKKHLQQLNLFNSSTNKLTVLGILAKNYTEHKLSSSKRQLGFYAELKVYEYYIENGLKKNKYKNVLHGVPTDKKGGDIDIELTKANGKILCEVKSFGQVQYDIDKIISQANYRLEFYNNNILEYRLIIHKLDFNDFSAIEESLQKAKNEIKGNFKVFYFEYELQNNEMPYMKFMQNPLKEIKEYDLITN